MNYAKTAVGVLTAILMAVVTAFTGDNTITSIEWVDVAIVAVGAAAVFAAPNVPGANYTKAILAGLSAVLVVLTSAITDGVSSTEWLQIAVAALGTLGVYAAPYQQSERLLSN